LYLGGLLLKGGEGKGEEGDRRGGERRRRKRKRGEKKGGREFVLCPRKKKEKSAPMVRFANWSSVQFSSCALNRRRGARDRKNY